ncbi:MAG: methyltransferase domain-containing protein, partial [Dehalococcoidia bacterium]
MKPKATEESGKQNPSTGEPDQTASLGFGMTPGDAKRYHGEIDLANLDHPRTQLILLTGQNKRVLEIGPSTGYISQALQQRGCTVTGLEIDPVAAEEAAQFCERMVVADAEKIDLASTFQDQKFDVVMLGDVLEHMVDPLSVLVAVRGLLRPKGYAVISIPNMAHGSVRLRLLNGEFRYRDTGLLDITHLRFFTAETLEELLRDAGYRITTWKRILLDPCDAELGVKEEDYPAYLMQAIRGDIEAMTYQFVVKAEPVPIPTRKRADQPGDSQTADSQGKQAERPAHPAEPVAASLLLIERELGDKNQHITNIEAALTSRDQHIANIKDALTAKDQHIANIEDALAETEENLSLRDHNITSLEASLDETQRQLIEVSQQFQAVTSSLGYRLLERVRAVINRLVPPGTRRRGALKLPRKGLRIIRTEGWRTFLRRAVRMLRRGFRDTHPASIASQVGPLDEQYQLWLQAHALTPAQIRRITKESAQLSYRPKVSIIMPTYNPDPAWLRDAIESVRSQPYDNWELCIADDASKGRAVRALLKEYRAEERIKV